MILLESLFVGFYTLLMYVLILNFSNSSMIINSFVIGFFKHFISGILGLQQRYCSGYFKCEEFMLGDLLIESIYQGVLFLILYLILTKFMKIDFIIFFIIGMILHISFKILGIHYYFCKSHCK